MSHFSDKDFPWDGSRKSVGASRPSAVQKLLPFTEGARPFTAHDGRSFARVPLASAGFQALPLRSIAFRNWFYAQTAADDHIPCPQTFSSILKHLEARAHADPEFRGITVGRRISPGFDPDTFCLDLANSDGEYVSIDADGWHVTNVEGVFFEPSRAARELLAPQKPQPDSSPLDILCAAFNLSTRADWLRCLAWLVSAFIPDIARPILVIQGPNGSGKSYLARILRTFIDPGTAPLQQLPISVRELRNLARFTHCLAFDRVAATSPQLSDALACLSSRTGLAHRESAIDSELAHEFVSRPILLTTTNRWSCPDDLAHRVLFVTLPAIAPDARRTEAALSKPINDAFEQILGALCDAVSLAIRRHAEIDPPGVPFADAATWAIAAAPSLGATEDEMRAALAPTNSYLNPKATAPHNSASSAREPDRPASTRTGHISPSSLSLRVSSASQRLRGEREPTPDTQPTRYPLPMHRLLSCLVFACAAYAAAPLFQASFQKPNHDFTVVSGAAIPDAAVLHNNNKSLRLEPTKIGVPVVRFAPVALTIGKRYELSGWVRTEQLAVRDVDRSPIAVGATLSMASMPFDVHSAALGGTQPWTRLSLRFIASRAQDSILLSAGAGGTLTGGKAWFEGVSLDEVGSKDAWPARDAVQTFGPAYRYPAAGWIYLHIEGAPYERGYQHGRLMAKEIPEYLERCAADLGSRDQWQQYRTTANALFLRGFDREILEEMRGIAEGASDAGARWMNRRIDLTDIVVANVTVEMGELASAVSTTATGLEGLNFDRPTYPARDSVLDHCSAFAATGPATRDGKMVIGHVTWWPLTLAEQTNVMLDIKPASGHRMLIQSYPGGIESGTDWYQNDAGVVLTETTINQTPFNIQGTPVAFRARRAIQYGGNIDEVVRELGTRNNGLYTNEWLIGDAKNNEIAMYELGTNHTKLWRSSKNEWFGNTPGFYWGNNNPKDIEVRLENYPDPKAGPSYIPFVPAPRDLAWQRMYEKYKGQIDEQFAFTAFRTAPLVSASTMDAKVVTADLASRLMVWAAIGKPNQREWTPGGRSSYSGNAGLYPSGYYLFRTEKPESANAAPVELTSKAPSRTTPFSYKGRVWKGWVLPASEADTWFVGGSATYYRILQSDDVERALAAQRIAYRGLKLAPPDAANRVRIEQIKGSLFLDSLRRKMGDDKFFQLMDDYFAANTTKTVTAQSFLDKAGVSFEFTEPADGPAYTTADISSRLASAAIVYGTVREAGANRYAAEQMQSRFLDRFESEVPIYKDFEVSDDALRHRDVVFVGRPEANSALAAWAGKLGVKFDGAMFQVDGETHASEREGIVLAAKNPLDPAHMILVVAGNDALRTVKSSRLEALSEYLLFDDGSPQRAGFIGMGASSGTPAQGRRR